MNMKFKSILKLNTENFSNPTISSGKLTKESEDVVYEWSRDPNFLRDYTNLIDKYYENELNLPDAYKKIDPRDMHSNFLIGRVNNEIISGVRITTNNKDAKFSLPNEALGFSYQNLFPELDLQNNRYCEVSRYAMHTDYRKNPLHYITAFQKFYEITKELKVKYLFISSTKARVRLFKSFATNNFKFIETKYLGAVNYYANAGIEVYVICFENQEVQYET
ncbi:MAG: GNAT family N-acyltransferase [Rickettsiales bacterium]|nr:GNAT family N-acyltransferase [Rickettsiales bacterium]